jgi:hypothetical protein
MAGGKAVATKGVPRIAVALTGVATAVDVGYDLRSQYVCRFRGADVRGLDKPTLLPGFPHLRDRARYLGLRRVLRQGP